MVAVAGVLLVTLPDSDDDVAAEPFALSASADEVNGDGDSGGESGALGPGDEVSNSNDTGEESGEASSESTFDRDNLNTFAAAGADDAQEARFAELAAVSLDVSRFSRKTTTTQAPATTRAPTTAAPTTTTEAPSTAAESTEAAAEDTTSTGAETTAAETTDGTDATETTDGTDATEETDGTDTTEAGGDEAAADTTETTEEQTTTTAPPTTEAPADNGFVDAGHGVKVPPILLKIRYCESRDNYTAANPYSSARGAYQFLTGSWAAYGHASRYGVSQAHLATPAQQDEAALITWQRDGTRPWNASRHCWG